MVAISPLDGQARKRTDRRQAIVGAATELFAERGFSGVSVQEIADAAGTHKTTVLYHFATKDALHEAVLDEALGRVVEMTREFLAGDFKRGRVAYLLDQMHAFYAEHPALARLLQRELIEPGSEAYFARFVDPIYVPAVLSLERAMEAGLIRPIDPAFFIHDTHVTLIGYFCHRELLERLRPGVDPYSVESLIARREFLVDRIFRQLTPERAARPRRKATATKGVVR
jgi:TetR/AcrR family transcriptional regulator